MYGLAASVHSEQLTLSLETAKHVKAGTVWINCHNMFDAAAGFGGYRQIFSEAIFKPSSMNEVQSSSYC